VRKRCLIRRKYPSTDYIPSEDRRARTFGGGESVAPF
jgi:hypothetical protein